MLQSELHTIESLIDEVVTYHDSTAPAPSEKRLVEIARLIESACERLRGKWIHHLFSSMKEQVIFRYVRFHQSGLTSLSDRLSELLLRPGAPQPTAPYIRDILRSLDELLDFVRHSLNGFFVTDMPQSWYRREQEQNSYQQMTHDLEADLQRLLPGSSLTTVISRSLLDQLHDFPNEQITYRQSSVIYRFIISLRYYLSVSQSVDDKGLFLFVYRMNLNSKRVVNWFKQAVNQPDFYPLGEVFEIMATQRSSSQPPVDPNETTIAAVLLPWIQESMETPAEKAVSLSALLQMPLNLSVAQFALFVRVCYRTGCLSLTNAAEIIRFFTAHFTTKRQDDVSIKSFTKGFYAMDQTAAAVIRDYLQRMIAFINKTYFP